MVSGAFVVVTATEGVSVDVESNPNKSSKSSLENDGNGSSVVLTGSVVFVLANASKLKFSVFSGFLLFSFSISLKKLFAKFSDSISNESSGEAVVTSFCIVVVVTFVVDDLTKVKMLLPDDDGLTGAISLLTFGIILFLLC